MDRLIVVAKKVNCVGGATRNTLLYKLKANVMQIPHILFVEPKARLRGCGLIAAYGLGILEDLKDTVLNKQQNNLIIIQDKELDEDYKILQKEFNRMYHHLIGYWNH